jgi:hypothetical protein
LRVGSDSLRSNQLRYVSAAVWAGDSFIRKEDNKAVAWLAAQYLRAFGPARHKDFIWWSGLNKSQVRVALSTIDTTDIGEDHLILTEDLAEFELFGVATSDSLVVLPQWDSYTMGYAPDGRRRFVSADSQNRIYGSLGATGGNAMGTVLVNGLAHGAWTSRFATNTLKIRVDLFEPLTSVMHSKMVDSFESIARFLKAKNVIIENLDQEIDT